MTIIEFGQKVLDYFENSTNDNDTILFSIDSDIYEQELFHGDLSSKEEFERRIKTFVNKNGLDLTPVYTDKDLYSIALAAHQIVLSYKYRDNNTINDELLNFYYPGAANSNILYTKYYGNNQYGKNYQEKLWIQVKTALKERINRNLIIPDFTNTSGQRDQRYIKAQLCLFRNLKHYFYIFYRFGFSKEIQYSKDEFLERIREIDLKLNNTLSNTMVDSIWDKLRNLSQEDFGNLRLDDNLLFDLLWTIYNSWDGTFPYEELNEPSDYYNPIYIELNDDDWTYNTESSKYFPTMLMSQTNCICYFRFFTYIGDNVWEVKDSVANDLPETESFVLLIKRADEKLFSKKCRVDYEPTEELLQKEPKLNNYLVLKYFSLPKDFYNAFSCGDIGQSNDGLQLCGGLKLFGRTYLNFDDDRLKPSVYAGSPRKEQIPETGIINGIKIEDYKLGDSYKVRLHLYNPIDNRNLAENSLLYDKLPELKFSKKREKKQIEKSDVDITSYKFKADLTGLISKGGFIPGTRIKVLTENGYINIKDFQGFSDCNKKQLSNIKFGWFAKDNELFSPSESVTDRLKIVKSLEFKIRLANGNPQITEFWVTELYEHSIEEYFGNDNSSKETILESDEQNENTKFKKEDCSDFKYIAVNEKTNYESLKHETPLYYDEIRRYQNALCAWLCHCGIATYQNIQNVCRNMIQKTEFSDLRLYGEAPEYQIFIPLLKIGIIIPVIKDNKIFFTVVPNYEEIILGSELETGKELQNYLMNISSLLESPYLFSQTSICESSVLVRCSKRSWSWISKRVPVKKLIYPCIYKYDFEPWKPVYFAYKNNHYLIKRNNPDAYSVCKSIINREHYFDSSNSNPAFEYYPEQKILVCRYFSDIPSLYTRLLMLADPKKYTEESIYLSGTKYFREQYFENIEYDFVKELDKKLSQ